MVTKLGAFQCNFVTKFYPPKPSPLFELKMRSACILSGGAAGGAAGEAAFPGFCLALNSKMTPLIIDSVSLCCPHIKGAQAWDIRYRVIYTERSHLGRWLEEWTKKTFCVKCQAYIHHFVSLPLTEYTVKIISGYWVCGKTYSTPTECAVKIIPRLLSGG